MAIELSLVEEYEAIAPIMGADSNLFLMAQNAHETLTGNYELSIEEE